jgi:Flp pilus assembly protein TadB
MAQTRKRRRRKRRGTQSGRIDRRRAARPRNRQEARARARTQRGGRGQRGQRGQRQDLPPTWRGAIIRGLIASGLFFVLVVLVFRRPLVAAAALAVLMLAFYIPMGYFIDNFFYRRRQRQREREREQQKGS